MKITAEVTGEAEAELLLEQLATFARLRLIGIVMDVAGEMEDLIVAAVSGRDIGPGKGLMRRAVHASIHEDGDRILVSVGPTRRAAWIFLVHEEGVHGEFDVKEHKRELFGKGITFNGATAYIPAHTRVVNYPGHHFMARAAQRGRAELLARLDSIGA